MSKKYFDRLLTGTGETNKEVKSKFGAKMLESMGWSKGQGVGKNMDGMTDCIQIKRREENQGLGDVNLSAAKTFKWGDAFWDDAYNSAAAKFKEVEIKPDKPLVNKQETSSSEESEQSDSSISSLEIEKSSVKLFTRASESKSEKSKKIKKDKKHKKDKKDKKRKAKDSDSD